MALIEVLTDSGNNVVGVRQGPQGEGRQLVTTVLQGLRDSKDMGLAQYVSVQTAKAKVDLSQLLTDEQKSAIKTVLAGAQVGDRIAFVQATAAEIAALQSPALADTPGASRPIIQVFFDP